MPWTCEPDGINEELCLVALLEGCDEKTTAAGAEAVTAVAKAAKAGGSETCFFYASKSSGVVEQVRKLCKLDASATPQLLLLDIPDNGGFYVGDATECTAESVSALLDAYKAGKLERKQLG